MKHLCIITLRYPTEVDPTALTFVQQFAWSIAEKIDKVSVICPLPINQDISFRVIPEALVETTATGKKINVYHPKYVTLGQVNIGHFNTAPITTYIFKHVVDNVLGKMSDKPDVLYGHFFTPAGVTACILGRKNKIPAFIAYGESTPWTIYQLGVNRTKRMVHNVAGIISVSSFNRVELAETGVVDLEKIGVFPNGFLSTRFIPKNKLDARRKFNIPNDCFVVCFVGHFIERKGISKLNEAMDNVSDSYLICAGKGEIQPKGEYVLYANRVNPNDLADFYSAADVFVLPTLNEGCCNAIIEAMACGLPIISSNLPFNDDILDDTNSIRIDPQNVNEITNAISKLKDNKDLREKLSQGSLIKAQRLTLEARRDNIISFIEERINNAGTIRHK